MAVSPSAIAGDLCDAHFVRLRRLAGAAQQTWDRVRCLGVNPRGCWHTALATKMDQSVSISPSAERELFARAMLTPRTSTRVDFMASFGVEWLDPTADRKLLERLLTFPLHIFRVGNRPRGLARELGHGRLPESVRLRRARAAHITRSDSLVRAAGGRLSPRLAKPARLPLSARNFSICRI